MKRRSERKKKTRKLRSRKRTTRTNRLRKNKTSRRTRRGETSRRTRKGKTSRRTRKGKTSRRRTRKVNKNKVYSGGDLSSPEIKRNQNGNSVGRLKCVKKDDYSWVGKLAEGFCMGKPASTIINEAKIPADIVEKYILQPFNFYETTPWLELVDTQWREILRETHGKPKAPAEEVGRNFYRTNVGSRSDQGLFFNSESYPYIPKIEGLKEGETSLSPKQANKCIENLGKKIGQLGLLTGNLMELAEKIMNYVDTTSLPSYTFPALVGAAFQTTPPIFRCMVGEGYIFVFIYYYLPMGDAKLMGTGQLGSGKYSSFVVRGISNNLYLDEYDESSGTIQIFPTEIVSINNIVDTDKPFRESFIDGYLTDNFPELIPARLRRRTNDAVNREIIDDMVDFIRRDKDFTTWVIKSEWAHDTGGEKDANGAPIRAQDGIWKELWKRATEIDRPVTPPGSPEISKGSESVAGIELVAGAEDDV